MAEHLLNNQYIWATLIWITQIGCKGMPKTDVRSDEFLFYFKSFEKSLIVVGCNAFGLRWIRFVGFADENKVKDGIRIL